MGGPAALRTQLQDTSGIDRALGTVAPAATPPADGGQRASIAPDNQLAGGSDELAMQTAVNQQGGYAPSFPAQSEPISPVPTRPTRQLHNQLLHPLKPIKQVVRSSAPRTAGR